MIIFEILFLVFIVSAEYAIYHYATKKYNNIKVDWYITTDLPDLAHYFFKDFKSNFDSFV